jgi:hypothetical protein
MSLGSLVFMAISFGLGIWAFFKLRMLAQREGLDTEMRTAARYTSNGVAILMMASVIISLGYFGIIKVPDAIRGPVVGSEIPTSSPRETPRQVAPPAAIAPLQPDTNRAMEQHRQQLDQMRR